MISKRQDILQQLKLKKNLRPKEIELVNRLKIESITMNKFDKEKDSDSDCGTSLADLDEQPSTVEFSTGKNLNAIRKNY